MAVDPPSEPQTASTVPIPDGDNLDKLPLMRTSVIIAMVMLLKAHLKSLYSISEEYVKVS
jgi:cohesin loading factor subunit SCC2